MPAWSSPGARIRRRRAGARSASLGALVAVLAVACSAGPDDGGTAAGAAAGAAVGSPSTAARSDPDGGSGRAAPRPSAGCGTEPPVGATDDPSGDVPVEMAHGDTTRRYRLGVPEDYEAGDPTPLVLNLHGARSSADQQTAYSQLAAAGTDRGYLVVTPDALDGMWELTAEGRDDEFLMALLDDLEQDFCVDRARVHAAGISLGAWKATVTACAHPERFASLALVAENVAPPGCALPVVAFHGTADDVVPYGAGADPGVVVTGPNAGLPGVEVNMPAWAENNGCATEHDVERIGPDVERWVFRRCPEGAGVELYSVRGGGHTWPGSPVELPGTTTTIDATGIALDWFDAHPQRD